VEKTDLIRRVCIIGGWGWGGFSGLSVWWHYAFIVISTYIEKLKKQSQ